VIDAGGGKIPARYRCALSGSGRRSARSRLSQGRASRRRLEPPGFFGATFKGLWLSESASLFCLALVFGVIVAKPCVAARRLVLVLALAPLACAVLIYATVGSFFAAHLLLFASAAALVGGTLHGEAPSQAETSVVLQSTPTI
jgi:hypothetical protein